MNRRMFVTVMAGLPLIGKYWEQPDVDRRIIDLPKEADSGNDDVFLGTYYDVTYHDDLIT